MPDFFDITLILKRKGKKTCQNWLTIFDLVEGENQISLFISEAIIVNCYRDELADFDELTLSLPNYQFMENGFDQSLKPISDLIEPFFLKESNLVFAVCSFEVNPYLLRNVKRLIDFDTEVLETFPIVFRQQEINKPPEILINLKAQDLF